MAPERARPELRERPDEEDFFAVLERPLRLAVAVEAFAVDALAPREEDALRLDAAREEPLEREEEVERRVRRPPLRWLAGISALTTSLVSWGIVFSRNLDIRSSWRR